MTVRELARMTDRKEIQVAESIRILMREGSKRIHICGHEPQVGIGGRARRRYAIGGDTPDAKEPALSSRQRNVRYRERNRALINARGRLRRGSPRISNPWQGLL